MSPPSRTQADLFDRVPDDARRTARPFDIAQVARAIWHSGVDPSGALTEQYAAALGLTLPDDVRGRVIRHHGSLAFAKDQRLPGMLTLLRDLRDGQPPLAGVEALSILIETGDGSAMRAATAVATNWQHAGRDARVIELPINSGAGS